MGLLWGIDLGGTKIEGVVVESVSSIKPLARIRIPTESDRGYDHIIAQIEKLIEQLATTVTSRPEKIGFSTPGALDPGTQAMKNCNTTCLNGRPLHVDLRNRLKVPCILANDANCFALAEATFGAAQGATGVFGIIMGTGVGGGLVYRGSVINGHHGIAGEWGHNVLDDKGEPCYCGKRGCVERVISGPALENFYQTLSGTKRTLKDIAERATTNQDPHAVATITRLRSLFGKAVAVVMNIFDPDVIVLGGGVSNVDALYTNPAELILPHLFNLDCRAKVVRNVLGDSAGVFGAAALCA